MRKVYVALIATLLLVMGIATPAQATSYLYTKHCTSRGGGAAVEVYKDGVRRIGFAHPEYTNRGWKPQRALFDGGWVKKFTYNDITAKYTWVHGRSHWIQVWWYKNLDGSPDDHGHCSMKVR